MGQSGPREEEEEEEGKEEDRDSADSVPWFVVCRLNDWGPL